MAVVDGPGSGSSYPPPSHQGWPPPGQSAYAPAPLAPGSKQKTPRGRVPGWLWPAVATLALLVGLGGGALGSLVYDRLDDDPTSSTAGGDPGNLDDGTVTDAPLPADNGSIAAVADQLLPSTVQIVAEFEGRANGATGSGFVLDREGHVVTNNHVVADAAKSGKIEIVDQDGNRFKADLVGRSPVY